jgi:hypothetical protein
MKNLATDEHRWTQIRLISVFICAHLWLLFAFCSFADWPTLRGDASRSGRAEGRLPAGPYHVEWVRYFEGERLGTAMEPIVADRRVFVATHNGSVNALDALSGQPLWRFETGTPFLQSPAFVRGVLVAADADGTVFGLNPADGTLRWSFAATRGGFAASPCAPYAVYIGSRAGTFYALDPRTGELQWHKDLGVPIRQTAATADVDLGNETFVTNVFVTSEDMRVHALDPDHAWTSVPLAGQSARDYYPVAAGNWHAPRLLLRTSPALGMPQRLARDLQTLTRNVGIGNDWKSIDAFIRRDFAGNEDLWAAERQAVLQHLVAEPDARSFFVLDAATGKLVHDPVPVLWAAGCQGVPAPPVVPDDGRAVTAYRTAYSNWNHGVAPFIGLGVLEVSDATLTPSRHAHGPKSPWNTFWGTSDESQNLTLAEDGTLWLIVHQSTLARYDLGGRLTPLAGERDSWGGYRNLPWALNEWNGPGRGGVAIETDRIYWLTGSRILCLAPGDKRDKPKDEPVGPAPIVTKFTPPPVPREALERELIATVKAVLARRWAPLYVQPGIAGREFFFDHSRDQFESLLAARPYLPGDLRQSVDDHLAAEWTAHPPYTTRGEYPTAEGDRREYFHVPAEYLKPTGAEKPLHPFLGLAACAQYAASSPAAREKVAATWPTLRGVFDDFCKTNWRLDRDKGDLEANRILAALYATASLARDNNDPDTAARATELAHATEEALVTWWQRAAARAEDPMIFSNVAELDRFLARGDDLFFHVSAHRAKLALFRHTTPEIAKLLHARCPDATAKVWRRFTRLCATWWLAGEERQVHYGENLFDPPDFSLDAFSFAARTQSIDTARRVDLPFCRADLFYIQKLALALGEK